MNHMLYTTMTCHNEYIRGTCDYNAEIGLDALLSATKEDLDRLCAADPAFSYQCEQERLAAERLAIVKAAWQAAQEREPEPEPEAPWEDLGGISDAQARLVRLNIGHPRRR